jgi:hypothetical protein
MLPVVPDPLGAPVVFGKGIHAAPRADDDTIIKFLGAAAATDPNLADGEDDCQDDAVRYEGTAHDEVRGTLSYMLALAEAESRDAPENHLRPGKNGECLSEDTMCGADHSSNTSVDAFLEVQLEVDAHADLGCKYKH